MPREALNGSRRWIALAGSTAVIAALAGCGGDDDESPDSTAPGNGPAATASGGNGGQNPAEFGEEAGPEDRAAAGATVQDFLRALGNDDGSKACSLMSASVKTNLELFLEGEARESVQNSCEELVRALKSQIPAKRLPPSGPIEVTAVRIEGDHGFVIYRDEEGRSSAFPVVRDDGVWKVAAIVGASLQ